MDTIKETGFYVYGIISIREDDSVSLITGIDGIHHLEVLNENGLHAAVSRVNLNEFGQEKISICLDDMVWVEEKARRHFNIQQQLYSTGALIPVKFCTIYTGECNIREYLRSNACRFNKALSYFSDKEEWTYKAYCNKKKFLEMNMEEERKQLQSQLINTSKGASYFMQKKLESTLDEKAKCKLLKIRENIWDNIKSLSDDAVVNKNLSRQATERNEDMILNAALLVSRKNTENLAALCRRLEEDLGAFNIYAELTGPWPVYNFSANFLMD